jgi:hypothetical protein
MGFVFLPVLFATYLASTLVLGYHHHGYDVIFGSLIGIVMAFFSYRMVFCSIHDPRWNTVPRRRFERSERDSRRLGLGGGMSGGKDVEGRLEMGMERTRRISSAETATGDVRPQVPNTMAP